MKAALWLVIPIAVAAGVFVACSDDDNTVPHVTPPAPVDTRDPIPGDVYSIDPLKFPNTCSSANDCASVPTIRECIDGCDSRIRAKAGATAADQVAAKCQADKGGVKAGDSLCAQTAVGPIFCDAGFCDQTPALTR